MKTVPTIIVTYGPDGKISNISSDKTVNVVHVDLKSGQDAFYRSTIPGTPDRLKTVNQFERQMKKLGGI